ncbi:MAG: ABC transporter ATP-binding protein [Planctomycetota bacterium]|nr:MAG: ABC transporter ATP-binding protein [Planctomycetota bacterium]
MPIIAEKLSVNRLNRPVLREVSIRIDDGQTVSIIGPNGAGKSTLMLALLGLLPTSGGRVEIDEKPMKRLPRRQIARKIAYVPQIHDGYMGFRVRDIVEAGRYTHLDPLESMTVDDCRAVDDAIANCHIEDLLDRTVDTLSGGERQKVWIAAALAQQSPTLFLDEPTNALDPAYQVELIRIMRRFAEAGNTLLVICHDLNLAMALGGRVIGLREGKLFFDRSHDVLEDTAVLAELFGIEFVLHHDVTGRQTSVQLQL